MGIVGKREQKSAEENEEEWNADEYEEGEEALVGQNEGDGRPVMVRTIALDNEINLESYEWDESNFDTLGIKHHRRNI